MLKSNLSAPKNHRKKKRVYLDYAAATPLDPQVALVMRQTYRQNFASPSSVHCLGMEAGKILEKARTDVAGVFKARPDEVIFTSGSTESNNLAILGSVRAHRRKVGAPVPHVVTTNIEHPSVLEVCKHLEDTRQARVTYVEVEANGLVDPQKIGETIRSNTVLVSVMYANSELGTVQPLAEIAKRIRYANKKKSSRILFHTDATQAVNYMSLDVEKLGVDLMSASSDKFYGPNGVGLLYVKRKTPIGKTMHGGDQQFNMRSGSYNLPGIAGLAEALKITEKIKNREIRRLTKLRNYFFERLENLSKGALDRSIVINGDRWSRLPNNVNITVPGIPSDLLVIELSERGVMVSEKSACKESDGKTSHVIEAIRKAAKDADLSCRSVAKEDGSLRFSLGRGTTKKDIDYAITALSKICLKLKKWYK